MKAADIQVGGLYQARISGNFVTVRVDAIRPTMTRDHYDVTNLNTKRQVTFRSAQRFRGRVVSTSTHQAAYFYVGAQRRDGVITVTEYPTGNEALAAKETAKQPLLDNVRVACTRAASLAEAKAKFAKAWAVKTVLCYPGDPDVELQPPAKDFAYKIIQAREEDREAARVDAQLRREATI